jgi:O-antigen/teichoic acid export membrane protein
MDQSLIHLTIKNIGYNALAKFSILILSSIAGVILARNLTASDYGIVGFAMIFTNFLERFSDLGISNAVVQKHHLDENELYTGFTLKCIFGVLVFLVAFVLSPLSKYFFDNAAIIDVIKILSLNFIISSFAFLPYSLLTRELNYKKLSISQMASAALSNTLAIIFALNGFKYWSIVIANVCLVVVNVILLNSIKPIRIKFSYSRGIASEFIHFGGNIFFIGLITFTIFNADNFLIGSVLGSAALGYYAIAFNWGTIICNIVSNTVYNVLFPTFSKIQNDKDSLKKAYLKTLEYVSFISILANIALFLISYEFLYYMLGHGTDRWLPALNVFKILCVYGILRSVLEPVGNVIVAMGKPNIIVKSNLVVGIIELSLLYPALKYFNIEGVAVLITIAYALQYFIYYPFLQKELNLNFKDIINAVKPAIISMLFVISVGLLFNLFVNLSLITFILKLILIPVSYYISYGLITKWRLVSEMKMALSRQLSSKRILSGINS